MLARDFPGADRFIHAIDDAVRAGSTPEITDKLRNALCRMIRTQEVKLPECCYQACGEHYARRELYQSEDLGYSVIAMTWGPGQGTSLHDHHGMWCVEGVWHGALEIVQYDLVEEARDHRFRFRPVGSIQAGAGSAGSLIPPHEYQTIRNPADDGVAVSVHIYSGPMTCCAVFKSLGDGWYERSEKQLGLDS
jgi:predicted metal-dependent enzyme (double-stranded beta helix superfamily)